MKIKRHLIVRGEQGEIPLYSMEDLVQSVSEGQCKMGDFVFDVSADKWFRVADHEALSVIVQRPAIVLERRLVYFHLSLDNTIIGPLTVAEARDRISHGSFGESNWVYVDGDTEWRKLSTVRALESHLPRFPTDKPKIKIQEDETENSASSILEQAAEPLRPSASGMVEVHAQLGSENSATPELETAQDVKVATKESDTLNTDANSNTTPSIQIDFDEVGALDSNTGPIPPAASARPAIVARIDHGENTEASIKTDALLKDITHSIPLPGPIHASDKSGIMINSDSTKTSEILFQAETPILVQPVPSSASPSLSSGAKNKHPEGSQHGLPSNPKMQMPARPREPDEFDGITVAIPTDPMWLIKKNESETVMGPYRFLDVVQFLKAGKFSRDDKISKIGAKRFVRIHQQFEFNVKYSVETVVENGMEIKKIYIRRRHPRVPYMTAVQVTGKFGSQSGNCVNISAGGILLEFTKAEMNLGEIVEIKLIPGLIPRSILCKALIIGKVPKAPPSYALKFEDLKTDDKEAIEYYVQKALNLNL